MPKTPASSQLTDTYVCKPTADTNWCQCTVLERVSHTCSDRSHSQGCWMPHNVRSTVLSFWIISHARGMSQMGSRLAVVFCNQDAGRKSIDNRKIYSAQAVQSCISCKKKSSSIITIFFVIFFSVVISICRESASVSSFPAAVTCSGLGLTASCPHHQFRQCRRLWGGEALGQMCVAIGKAQCNWFFQMARQQRQCASKIMFYQGRFKQGTRASLSDFISVRCSPDSGSLSEE